MTDITKIAVDDWLNPLINPMVMKGLSASLQEKTSDGRTLQVPSALPILPLRGMVVYPMTAVPIRVGQPRSVQLIDEAVNSDQIIGLVASKDAELEKPGPDWYSRDGPSAIQGF
jgi:ATP-dependent Lon protease